MPPHSDGRARLALAAALTIFPPAGSLRPTALPANASFPATILTDDPFVADEMSLPQVTVNPPGPDGARETDIQIDLSKRITPDIGVTIGDQWQRLKPTGPTGGHRVRPARRPARSTSSSSTDRTRRSASLGLNVTWAHTGRVQALGAPDFTTLSPTFDFGKGLGDLPRSLPYLRPFAITGNLGFDFPTKIESAGVPNPNNFNYGFAFEYSLPYLQCCVKDIGLRAPFNRLIPLVEVAFTTPINRVPAGQTIGTIQPGIIWAGPYFQIGAEAILPATRLTGHGYGGVVQFHFYLDDLFPRSIGRPISEWW